MQGGNETARRVRREPGVLTVEEEGLAAGSGGGPGSRRLWGEGSKCDRKGQACWTMTYITPLDAHSFPEKVKLAVLVAELCPTFCDPTDCSLPGSSVPGILQAILRWVASPFSRESSQPRNQTRVSRTAGGFFTS